MKHKMLILFACVFVFLLGWMVGLAIYDMLSYIENYGLKSLVDKIWYGPNSQ